MSDLFVAERALGGVFLLIQEREIGGAHFESDLYLGYDADQGRFELFAFSSTRASGRNLPDTFRITKAIYTEPDEPPLVIEVFRRQPPR